MEITFTDYMIRKEHGTTPDPHNTVIIAEEPFKGWPPYKGHLRRADEDQKERESLIKYALQSFGFLIPANMLIRICYLGELIKRHTTEERAQFIGDICLINGQTYSPIIKHNDGTIKSI